MDAIKNITFLIFLFSVSEMRCQLEVNSGGNLSGEQHSQEIEEVNNPEINRIAAIVEDVERNNNFIELLSADSNVALPFGIIKQIGAVRYTIAIDSMKFLPTGA